jgi:hypothetical protein
MVLCQWKNLRLFGQAVSAFANLAQAADVLIREFTVQDEASQRVSLPHGTILRPFEYFF